MQSRLIMAKTSILQSKADQIIKLVSSGLSYQAVVIQLKLPVSHGAVRQFCNRMGYYPSKNKLYGVTGLDVIKAFQSGLKPIQIIEKLKLKNISIDEITDYLKSEGVLKIKKTTSKKQINPDPFKGIKKVEYRRTIQNRLVPERRWKKSTAKISKIWLFASAFCDCKGITEAEFEKVLGLEYTERYAKVLVALESEDLITKIDVKRYINAVTKKEKKNAKR
jgi:hypothetical protein